MDYSGGLLNCPCRGGPSLEWSFGFGYVFACSLKCMQICLFVFKYGGVQ